MTTTHQEASRRNLNAPTSLGFTLRFAILAALLLVVPSFLGFSNEAPLRYLPSAAAAAVVLLGYLVWRVEALLAFAIFVLFYETLVRWMGVPIKQIDEIAVPALFAVAGARSVARWRDWVWWPRDLSIAVALGLGVLSSLAADVPLDVWVPALGLVAKGLAFFYVAMWTGAREWELRAGMWIGLAVGVTVMALSFVELVDPLAFQRAFNVQEFYQPRGSLPSLKSLFFHPVLYAWFTAFVALYLYAHFAVTRRWWSLLLALVISLGPFLAARRRAMLALMAGIGGGLVRTAVSTRSLPETVRRWALPVAGMFLLVMVFLPGLTGLYQFTIDRYLPPATTPAPSVSPGPGVPTEPGGIEGEANPQVRIALYEGSLQVARDYFPLGGGLGRYASWMSRVEYSPLYAQYDLDRVNGLRPRNPRNVTDTFWPQILGELGALGFLAYAGFVASLAWILWRLGRDSAGSVTTAVFRLGTGMVFVQALVESLASPMFHSPPRAYLVFLVVGLVASAWRRRTDE